MPSRLSDNDKSLVIQEWLNGEQRDKIAGDNGLGAGSVTNIVNEWRAALGSPTADALRDLAVTLRRVGITAAQCALGFRIATLMLRIGVKEELRVFYFRCLQSLQGYRIIATEHCFSYGRFA
jgi:hypothetical protein